MAKFHEKLSAAIRRKGMSRSDVLARLGNEFSPATLSNWLMGKAKPSFDVAANLAEMLDLSLDYLADDSLDSPPGSEGPALSPGEDAVLRVLRALHVDPDDAIRQITLFASRTMVDPDRAVQGGVDRGPRPGEPLRPSDSGGKIGRELG